MQVYIALRHTYMAEIGIACSILMMAGWAIHELAGGHIMPHGSFFILFTLSGCMNTV